MRQAPTFLYPYARKFAFDEVCERIVRALAHRHFDVPGIDVQFDLYGSGEQRMRQVRRITGQTFSLHFCRKQGLLPDGIFIDTAAVNAVAIPGEKIEVYEDNSGPSYYRYVGEDWEADRKRFFGYSGFVNSKLRGEPRIYLRYSASDDTSRRMRYGNGELATYLLHDNDIGREYELEDGDESLYLTAEVIERMTRHLESELAKIEQSPEKEGAYHFEEESDIPIEGCPEFWTYAEGGEVRRIKYGQDDLEDLPLARRYAIGQGYRLLAYGVSAGGLGIDPDILHDGYVWSSLNPKEIPRESSGSGSSGDFGKYLVRIKPTRANNIYVVDEAEYDICRARLGAELEKEGRTRFTDKEVGEMKRARAKTLVPWNEYQGDFEKPVIIIGRELGFDEVQVIEEVKKASVE